MTTSQINTVKETWLSVAALDPLMVGELFYLRLFKICPEVRPMFRQPMPEQSKKLLHMLHYIISKLHKLDDIIADIKALARRHTQYGVTEEHYIAVGSALLWTLEQGLGESWNEEVEASWTACYTLLSGAMMEAGHYEQVVY